MGYKRNIFELVNNIKTCLDIMYSSYKDMYSNKQSTSETQIISKETSIKNKLFSNLLSTKNTNVSHTSFYELYYYLDRVSAETNFVVKYETLDILVW